MAPMDFNDLRQQLAEKHDMQFKDADLLSAALYPKVFDDFVVSF